MEHPTSVDELSHLLLDLRARIEMAFCADTAIGGVLGTVPSTGHCAAVAAIVNRRLGGKLASASVHGVSHWFNRFEVAGRWWDADITGDQFGLSPIRLEPEGALFEGTRERQASELNEETRRRSVRLARRAGLDE